MLQKFDLETPKLRYIRATRSRSCSKIMIACFFCCSTGNVATVCLTVVVIFDEIPHHDNASSHIARQTIDYLKNKNIAPITHFPYLLPNNLIFFPNAKPKMRRQ